MDEKLLIVGSGGHAKEVLEIAEARWMEIAGFYDEGASTPGELRGFTVSNDLSSFEYSSVVIAIGNNKDREALSAKFSEELCEPLIHPQAMVSPSALLGAGTMVMPGAVISADATIGTSCIIGQQSYIAHDCVIGNYAHVATGCMINGAAAIGSRVLIGSNATLLPGVKVDDGAVCGAGSVILDDVASSIVVAGVPARPI